MTVSELFEQLQEFDGDTEVCASFDGLSMNEIQRVNADEDDRAIIRLED